MQRASLMTIGVLLTFAASAGAKGGVVFDRYTEQVEPGETIGFTVMAYQEPEAAGLALRPIEGRRPLVTFRSRASQQVLRVRASRTDLNGIAYGKVAFPDKGPWTTRIDVGRRLTVGAERSDAFDVGGGLTQTIPADEPAAKAGSGPEQASPSGHGWPWAWPATVTAIGGAGLAFVLRRRHWRPA